MSQFITEKIESGVQILCIDRVEKRNAITLDMYQTLADLLQGAEKNNEIRVTLIQGNGGCFSSGNDINEFVKLAQMPEKMESTMAFLQAIATYKKPLIAAVEGRAVGVGATMLLHCDLVLSSRETRFQFPFVQLGLVPEAASSYLLPKLVGHQKAFELLVLGEAFDAQEAYELSLVNHLCEEGEAYKVALVYAEKMAALPPEAVALSKGLLKFHDQDNVKMTLIREGRIFKDRLCSPEAHQAFSTFLSRNK
jgi:enoyl-CoA hydratase/carnithine racemase